MPRALDAHNEEAREHDARGGDVSRLLSQSCELRSLCNGRTEHNDISRDTAIKPEQWKADVAAGEWFVCAEPKASCGAGNGACGLRPANTRPRRKQQRPCKRIAEPFFLSHCGKDVEQWPVKNGQTFGAPYQRRDASLSRIRRAARPIFPRLLSSPRSGGRSRRVSETLSCSPQSR